MPWAWVPLLLLTADAEATAIEASAEPGPAAAHHWSASVQVGAGMVEEDPAALIRPRLGYSSSVAELTLGFPMWLRLQDRAPAGVRARARDEVSWLCDWRAPETYAALVEQLDIRVANNRFRLSAGALKQETLGYGALVDGYSAP